MQSKFISALLSIFVIGGIAMSVIGLWPLYAGTSWSINSGQLAPANVQAQRNRHLLQLNQSDDVLATGSGQASVQSRRLFELNQQWYPADEIAPANTSRRSQHLLDLDRQLYPSQSSGEAQLERNQRLLELNNRFYPPGSIASPDASMNN